MSESPIQSQSQLRVAYLNNPDPVFFNELDTKLQENLISQGAIVIPFQLDDISIKIQTSQIKFYLKDSNEEFQFDAFISYGYMSKFSDVAFFYLLTAIEKANKYVLHSTNTLSILNNKLMQAFSFSGDGVNIPRTFSAFSIPAIRNVVDLHFKPDEVSISKNFVDYGGDGVRKCDSTDFAVNNFARFYWGKEYTMLQKFISDSIGKSVRVFIVGGKTITIAEYQDLTGDFRSNVSFHGGFKLLNLQNCQKKKDYSEIAEHAVNCIGNINVCGVDLLDSKEKGIIVLEINAYPELYDISK